MSISLQVGGIQEKIKSETLIIKPSFGCPLFFVLFYYTDGTVLLLYLPPNSPYPNDGIRWQDNEIKAIIPAGPRVR